MVYSPSLSKEQLEKKFSKLRKLNYNRFRWWRMYDNPKENLHKNQPFRDRIMNGDFEFSHFKYQAMWCEHDLNKIWEECEPDIGKYNEQSSILKSRRKRLMEDFERDEKERLSSLTKEFQINFKIDKEQIEKEMMNFDGSILNLYYHIEDKYKKFNIINKYKS